jgi:hypothetical protein
MCSTLASCHCPPSGRVQRQRGHPLVVGQLAPHQIRPLRQNACQQRLQLSHATGVNVSAPYLAGGRQLVNGRRLKCSRRPQILHATRPPACLPASAVHRLTAVSASSTTLRPQCHQALAEVETTIVRHASSASGDSMAAAVWEAVATSATLACVERADTAACISSRQASEQQPDPRRRCPRARQSWCRPRTLR